MAQIINVDEEALARAKQKVTDQVEAHRRTVQSIIASVDASSGGWTGPAAVAHRQMQDSLHTQYTTKQIPAMDAHQENLGASNKSYSSNEQNNTQIFKGSQFSM